GSSMARASKRLVLSGTTAARRRPAAARHKTATRIQRLIGRPPFTGRTRPRGASARALCMGISPVRQSLLRAALAHPDLAAAVLEADLVHDVVDEEDAAPTLPQHAGAREGGRHRRDVEPRPRVPDDDQQLAGLVAGDAALDLLARVVVAAVLDRVR